MFILNDVNYGKVILIFFGILLGIIAIAIGIVVVYKKYTYYPNLTLAVDISNKRSMSDNDAFDYYVINFGTNKLINHINVINNWKNHKLKKLQEIKRKSTN